MQSPITGKEMKLMMEPASLPFRKEEFEVVYHFYLCEDTEERFTDDALDTINLTQVYNQYREKYGIPFSEDIRSIRHQYGVPASKMSVILGFGANQYRLYENGEIPSVANGRLILAVREPNDFIKQVKASEHLLSETEVTKFVHRAEKLQEMQQKDAWGMMLAKRITHDASPSEYTGYNSLNFGKIAQVISFFSQSSEVNKTKLNKLLFYADFGCYKQHSRSITGLDYRAIQFGPVPAEYDKLYMKLEEDGAIVIESRLVKDYVADNFKTPHAFDESLFTPEELAVLEKVKHQFLHLSTTKLVEMSHDEAAWTENHQDKSRISYQRYAFTLKHYC